MRRDGLHLDGISSAAIVVAKFVFREIGPPPPRFPCLPSQVARLQLSGGLLLALLEPLRSLLALRGLALKLITLRTKLRNELSSRLRIDHHFPF